MNDYDANVINYWGNKRKYYKTTTDVGFLSPSSYDSMLAFNVVIMEAFDASACNVILDCISRNTPLIINPHPAIVEYLGKDYPLYFKHPDEVNSLMNKIEKANIYMKNMDKSDLTLDVFSNKIMENIRTIKI